MSKTTKIFEIQLYTKRPLYNEKIELVAGDIFLYCLGGSTSAGASIAIPTRYGLVKLKKIFNDYWIATGDCAPV